MLNSIEGETAMTKPIAYRCWCTKWHCWEYSEEELHFPAVPAGTEMIPLYTSNQEAIKDVLNDVLASIVKEEQGAICSSLTHLNMAVVKLLALTDSFNAEREEADAVLFAIGECVLAGELLGTLPGQE
jgi:hypothetical protein